MATKKYATEVVLDAKGKPTKTRSIIASGEKVKDGDDEVAVTTAITEFVIASGQEKIFKDKKEKAASVIRTFVADFRAYFRKKGDFTKTYKVLGDETKTLKYIVDVTSTDKFSAPKNKEDLASFKREITAGVFNQLFEENATISIKKTIMDDDKKRRELAKLLVEALGEDKVKEYFEREVSYDLKSDLIEVIYGFPEETQKLITAKIEQNADSIKDASEPKA